MSCSSNFHYAPVGAHAIGRCHTDASGYWYASYQLIQAYLILTALVCIQGSMDQSRDHIFKRILPPFVRRNLDCENHTWREEMDGRNTSKDQQLTLTHDYVSTSYQHNTEALLLTVPWSLSNTYVCMIRGRSNSKQKMVLWWCYQQTWL